MTKRRKALWSNGFANAGRKECSSSSSERTSQYQMPRASADCQKICAPVEPNYHRYRFWDAEAFFSRPHA